MGGHVYNDAIVDVVGPQTVVSQPVVVKVRQRSPIAANGCSQLPSYQGPAPARDHAQTARLLLSLQADLDRLAAHQSARLRPLLRHLLHQHPGPHPGRHRRLRRPGWRPDPRGGVAAGRAPVPGAANELRGAAHGPPEGDELQHGPGVGADALEADCVLLARAD